MIKQVGYLCLGLFIALTVGQAQRIIVEGVDRDRAATIQPVSQPLATPPPRLILEWVDRNRQADVTLPDQSPTVPPRLILEWVDRNRQPDLAYPRELIADDQPPRLVQSPRVSGLRGDSVTLSWQTDEYSLSGVWLAQTDSWQMDATYSKHHSHTLTNIQAGQQYGYRLRNIDLSGNHYESSRQTFMAQFASYLPLITR